MTEDQLRKIPSEEIKPDPRQEIVTAVDQIFKKKSDLTALKQYVDQLQSKLDVAKSRLDQAKTEVESAVDTVSLKIQDEKSPGSSEKLRFDKMVTSVVSSVPSLKEVWHNLLHMSLMYSGKILVLKICKYLDPEEDKRFESKDKKFVSKEWDKIIRLLNHSFSQVLSGLSDLVEIVPSKHIIFRKVVFKGKEFLEGCLRVKLDFKEGLDKEKTLNDAVKRIKDLNELMMNPHKVSPDQEK